MTPPDAPDAPRDLLGQITEALREYELENYAPVEENAADWLALLVQRTRQAERDNEVLEQDYSNCRRTRAEAEAETARLREALVNLKRGACWCEVGIGNPMVRGVHSNACQRALDVVGASRPEEPQP